MWEAACHAILGETGLLAQTSGRSYNSSVFALCQHSAVPLSPRDGKSDSGHGQCLPEFPTVLGNKVSLTTGKLVGLVTSGHLSFFSLQCVGVNVHVEARGQLRLWWLRRHPLLYISDLSMKAGSPGGPELIKLAKLAGQ